MARSSFVEPKGEGEFEREARGAHFALELPFSFPFERRPRTLLVELISKTNL